MKKGEKTMKFTPVGIIREDGKLPCQMRASDYSDKLYDGVQLRKAQNGDPVIIMHCRRDDPMRWKVIYGFSTIFFRSFAEAVEFCNSRGMEIMREQSE